MGVPIRMPPRAFQFERDTFAYAHELVWQYRFDPGTGAMTTWKTDPPAVYYHRCFVMVRAIRQFFFHAHFAPELPALAPEAYRKLILAVVARDPRSTDWDSDRLVFPGYEGLRAFSREHEALLKAECGAAWESYFLRSHWRMVFPTPPRHQEKMARQLKESLAKRTLVPVHLFRFPRITINHGIVLYAITELEGQSEFEGYDPNIPANPVRLTFDHVRREFTFPPLCYWGGGPLSVIEIYRGGLY